jgi:hypothetical protein
MASDSEEASTAVVLDVGAYHLSYGNSGEETPNFSKLATATEDDTNNGQVRNLLLLKLLLFFQSASLPVVQ